MDDRKYQSHSWHDRADLAYIKAAAKRKALAAKKKREAFTRAEMVRSAKAARDADVCFGIVPSTSDDDIRMRVSKVVYGKS